MHREPRESRLARRRADIVKGFEDHVATLEALQQATTFDFDIATDLHPELIDNTTEAGRQRLAFWTKLYEELAKEPKYTVIRRYQVGLVDGCYGFGAEPQYQIDEAWTRVYTDLPSSAIQFERSEEGTPRVVINHPSVLGYGNREESLVHDESNVLFQPTHPSLWRDKIELLNEPELFFYDDVPSLTTGFYEDFSKVGDAFAHWPGPRDPLYEHIRDLNKT